MTRLHAADTLTDLATHDDAVGAWARDRLVLWYPEQALQTSATSRFAGLLGPEGIVHAIDNGTPVTRSMALMHTGLLGAMDPEHSGLVDALTRALDLGHAPTTLLAANALAWCGALPAARLADVVQSGTDRPLMGATVLLSQPTASVATSVVGELDDTGRSGIFAPPPLIGSRMEIAVGFGAMSGGGFMAIRPTVLVDPHFGLEITGAAVVNRAGQMLMIGGGGIVNIFPEWPVVPFFAVGGGVAFSNPNSDTFLLEEGQIGTLYGGGGLRFGFRKRVILRVDVRAYAFFEANRYVAREEYSGGMSVFF